jgi:hypothetical protein
VPNIACLARSDPRACLRLSDCESNHDAQTQSCLAHAALLCPYDTLKTQYQNNCYCTPYTFLKRILVDRKDIMEKC